jgi:hypothetical protein
MLRRTAQTVRAVAESAGIIAPNLADAQSAAEQHRQSLVVAQSSLEAAEHALQAAHDRGAELGEIERMEAAHAAAKQEATRAEARYRGAEKRLASANAAEAASKTAAARVRLAQAIEIRATAAEKIDTLAAAIAEQVRLIDAQDTTLAGAMRDGVAANSMSHALRRGQRAAELALSKHGAIGRSYWGDSTQAPGAADVILRDNGALLAA